MPSRLRALFVAPIFVRIGYHARRIGGQLDRHFFTSLLTAVIGFVVVATLAVTLLEPDRLTLAGFGSSFYWAITTVIGGTPRLSCLCPNGETKSLCLGTLTPSTSSCCCGGDCCSAEPIPTAEAASSCCSHAAPPAGEEAGV